MVSMLYVSFTDTTEEMINGVFGAEGNSTEVWPYQGTVLSTDARYAAYYSTQGIYAASLGLITPGD